MAEKVAEYCPPNAGLLEMDPREIGPERDPPGMPPGWWPRWGDRASVGGPSVRWAD